VTAAGTIRVGIGGWIYAPWRGTFYPAGLPQAQELHYASRRLTAIEINGTFYGAQKPASYRRWHDETPEDFVFSLKGPRFVTYRRDFTGVNAALDRFFRGGVLELGDKLGPILWQFPPTMRFEEGAFAGFLEALPREVAGRALRHVVEVRHASFAAPAFFALLRRHRVAIALVDDDNFPRFDEPTGDVVYARLRRCAAEEPTGYPPQALDAWAAMLRERSAGGTRDCFLYFIDGAKLRAPAAAQALLDRLG
jgi:uncharacterized protein YecE (DUF72 family)